MVFFSKCKWDTGRLSNSRRWTLIYSETQQLWFVSLIYMDGCLHGVHYNRRCCHHYRCYGDKRADKVSSKSISKSELFSPALLWTGSSVEFIPRGGAQGGLLNHSTSNGGFRKSMRLRIIYFFPHQSCHEVEGRRVRSEGGIASGCEKVDILFMLIRLKGSQRQKWRAGANYRRSRQH